MQIIYAQQEVPETFSRSIFLAGPSPRDPEVKSWRPEAIDHLSKLGFDGVVYVPVTEDGQWNHSYEDQVEWEEKCLHMSDCVLFWIPRDLKTMPGCTTVLSNLT